LDRLSPEKFTWCEQTVMPHTKHLVQAILTIRAIQIFVLGNGQYGVTNRLEGLRNQSGADGSDWIATAQGQQPAPKPQWHRRRRKEVARQVDHVAQIVLAPKPRLIA
jgi:hypothetical protein